LRAIIGAVRPAVPVQVKRLRAREDFVAHLAAIGAELPLDESLAPALVLGEPLPTPAGVVLNRFAVLPMEGWDGSADGRPTDLVRRRWSRFGQSGAGLVWGGEAVAVVPEGRANPHQLCLGPDSTRDLTELHDLVVGETPDAVVGLQLTHSGRWSRPQGDPRPVVAYRHPLLDERVGATEADVITDAQLDDLVAAYVAGAVIARDAGFKFVDVKHCHGYLLHELLTAYERPGRYGGDLDRRTAFLRAVIAGIRRDAPDLAIGVRLSAFDVVPHATGADGRGEPLTRTYRYAFGGDGSGRGIDLTEVHAFCRMLVALDVRMLCVTAGSPYYCPHVQRPAFFPPSDGYLPPRDPLLEVAQLLDVTATLSRAHPELIVVASGLSYLQEWLPEVAAALVASGGAHSVGYGRGVLSCPELARTVLADAPLDRARLCRTFSDCTTSARLGLVSGCYPLDPHYKESPARAKVAAAKRAAEAVRGGRRVR
jgi:2,4-dienoyl-CoA reductase-like NADH-dependent reductase (Old Yellow Enzyme family)